MNKEAEARKSAIEQAWEQKTAWRNWARWYESQGNDRLAMYADAVANALEGLIKAESGQ